MAQKSKQKTKPAAKKKAKPKRAQSARRPAPQAKRAAKARPKPASKAKRPAKKAAPARAPKPKPKAKAKAKPRTPAPAKKPVAAPAPKPAPPTKPRPAHAAAAKPKPAPPAPPAPTPVAAKPASPKPAPKLHRVAARPEPAPAPPPEPATPLDIAALRVRLETKKREIMAMYLNDLRSGQESNDSPTEDIVDRANNAYSRELNFSISDAERSLLLQVEEAIARIDNGKFGRCTHCGQTIARPRLEAIPWARLCINCQELLEQGLLPEG